MRRATVVVEARERSGALITADLALEEGREVLAVPGEITSQLSKGTNALLRLGATPVTCAADVLEAIGVDAASGTRSRRARRAGRPGSRSRRRCARRGRRADRRTGLSAGELAAALVELELLGLVAQANGLYREVMTPT